MPSPLSVSHSNAQTVLGAWLTIYAAHTPGCRACDNATTYMLEDAPQPDLSLRIESDSGGQTTVKEDYLWGAPELVVEICRSSTAYDLHQKKDLYAAAGVQEYVTVVLDEQEIRWHRLVVGRFQQIHPLRKDGILCSLVFPGLWLDSTAVFRQDDAKVLATLQLGLKTPAHEEFISQLHHRKTERKK